MKKVLIGIARFLYAAILASFVMAAVESITIWFKELFDTVQKIQRKVELIEVHQEVDREILLRPTLLDVQEIKKKVDEF